LKVYEGNGWTVINSRWQDSPAEMADHIITDPPYDERTHKNGRKGKGWKGPKVGDRRTICENDPKSFDPITPAEIAAPLLARSRRWFVAFCAVEQLGEYRAAVGDCYLRSGVWVKTTPAPQFTGDRPGQFGDGIAVMHRAGRKRWNGGGHALALHFATENSTYTGRDRVHETQKPVDLMVELIELFTDPGDLVWDPYGGSMTTGVACLMRGRRFIGHEMQERYAEVGAERLKAAEQGLTLSAARAGQMPLFAK
jgi:site-specific DNA-methyltransferase (adenine-specific)